MTPKKSTARRAAATRAASPDVNETLVQPEPRESAYGPQYDEGALRQRANDGTFLTEGLEPLEEA